MIRGINAVRRILPSVLALSMLASLIAAHASGFKLLYSFTAGADGCYPAGGVTLGGAGNLYGTTAGGAAPCNQGAAFKLAPDGTLTPLYLFSGGAGGSGPGGLVMDQKGNLWGSTCCGGVGGGVIFKINAKDHESVAHTFQGSPNDGCSGGATMVVDASGNLYGTTFGCGKFGYGAVYKVKPDGSESLLYSFRGGHNGYNPFAGVTLDTQGNLYGVTDYGGRLRLCTNGAGGCGTIFKLTPNGTKTLLYAFKGPLKDGYIPAANPIMDAFGNLYGTTAGGGIGDNCEYGGCGIVFKLTPDGSETVLHFFKGGRSDGSVSIAGMIEDGAGNLYGTTEFGGGTISCNMGFGCGTVFKIAPDGTLTLLHKFKGPTDGANPGPSAGLVADAAGNLYGTAQHGGANGYGTVFEITP
ncbi:MAG TPA: choice-of-anchor tandem repeat GloVer-containing protein [Rhizomicrobium sp.]|jgi:uncharacterized repeat protein (TIGR03803 family)|nr:choice-of-anchor tandem repeat GloVer-containing protein [Rhizomicrobium sp.]